MSWSLQISKEYGIVAITKKTKLSILFQWQSNVVDPVDPSLPSFLYSFCLFVIFLNYFLYIHVYIIELACSRPEYNLNAARWT